MPEYEYVKKSEYAPVRRELEEIIHRVQGEMKKTYGMTFQFRLIGSGGRHLITRIRNGNSGYDFDYNLMLLPPENGDVYKADVIKRKFMNAFKVALRDTQYSFPKDSTSALTIKVVDKLKKRIIHSCDFAIIYYGTHNGTDGYFYLRNSKIHNTYEFAFRPLKSHIDNKVCEICNTPNGWDFIRGEYLHLKNRNQDRKKHSFSLYIEAVNNVYNQLFYQ